MYNKFFRLVSISIIVFTIVVKNAELMPFREIYITNEPVNLDEDGLYDTSDDVVPLHSDMMDVIGASTTAYLVEFYAHWCGHCQHFASTWKSLASSIVEWKDLVIVAAIDCANENYSFLCTANNVTGVPFIKYYSPGADANGGRAILSRMENQIRKELIANLIEDKEDEKGDTLPNILPFSGNNSTDVWKEVPDTVKYLFFLFENTRSFLGSEVILDLHKLKNLQLHRVTEDNRLFCSKYNVTSFPALIVLHREEEQVRLSLPVPTRESVVQMIKDFMKSKGLFTEPDKPVKVENNVEENQNNTTNNEYSNSTERPKEDLLYQLDLESALRYSLKQEIPLRTLIEGPQFQALKNFLSVIAKYFSLKRGNSIFLTKLYDEMLNRTNITGVDFKYLVVSLEVQMSPVFVEGDGWIGCAGSVPGLRGYPCGLWTLFHTLTVRHAKAFANEKQETRSVGTILNAMYGYISNFFTCSDCVQHFVKMAGEEKIFEVEGIDNTILWLWRAHNKVNSRLAGDITEDPKAPKIQYPSQENCGVCRNSNGTWNEPEILNYLKKKYSSPEIVLAVQDYWW